MFSQRISKSNVGFSGSKDHRKVKQENFVNGSLAIKSHASWMKILTVGKHWDDEMELSEKTSSTLHTANAREVDLNVHELKTQSK